METNQQTDCHFASRSVCVGLVCTLVSLQASSANSSEAKFRFELVRGDQAICRAYVEALNDTSFSKQPYCDRPELKETFGFQPMKRTPLTESEVKSLYPVVQYFLEFNNEAYQRPAASAPMERVLENQMQDQEHALRSYGFPLYYKLWPAIDLNADGHSEQLLVWKRNGLRCGEQYGSDFNGADQTS